MNGISGSKTSPKYIKKIQQIIANKIVLMVLTICHRQKHTCDSHK